MDPLPFLHVLDAIMRLTTTSRIRSSELVGFMESDYPAFHWSARPVGAILKSLCEAGERVFGEGRGLLVREQRDMWGYAYTLHVNQATVNYANTLYGELEELVSEDTRAILLGRKTDYFGDPLSYCPSSKMRWTE
jgi:hypothetical protein